MLPKFSHFRVISCRGPSSSAEKARFFDLLCKRASGSAAQCETYMMRAARKVVVETEQETAGKKRGRKGQETVPSRRSVPAGRVEYVEMSPLVRDKDDGRWTWTDWEEDVGSSHLKTNDDHNANEEVAWSDEDIERRGEVD